MSTGMCFPILSVSASFKLVLHWLWWAGFGVGKTLKLQHLSLSSDLEGTLWLLHVKLRPPQLSQYFYSQCYSQVFDSNTESKRWSVPRSDMDIYSCADSYVNPLICFNHVGSHWLCNELFWECWIWLQSTITTLVISNNCSDKFSGLAIKTDQLCFFLLK